MTTTNVIKIERRGEDYSREYSLHKMNLAKNWKISPESTEKRSEIEALAKELSLSRPTATVLTLRGYRDFDSASAFLKKEYEQFYSPFLLADMEKTSMRIITAIDGGEKIRIYGDYDVDGVTSVSTLYLYLKSRGADVSFYIPDRLEDGYGVNITALDKMKAEGVSLMITVDTGITAFEEAEHAAEIGIDMIITDHHECHESIPCAYSVVNPKRADCDYPFKELAGVGVVFKLLCALEHDYCERDGSDANYFETVCNGYADLIAIGTVADVMPLIGENRLIVSYGMKMIDNSPRQGIASLLEHSGFTKDKKKRVTSSVIGYTIAPRINAAGRLANASIAVELFLTDSVEKAEKIAERLCEINRDRQNEENKIFAEALEMMKERDLSKEKVIVLANDGWHHGVIGIVASRLTDMYDLPSFLISFDKDTGKGSGRSVKGLNLVDALAACRDSLEKFGGHELAAGLTISREKLEAFRKGINEYAEQNQKTPDDAGTLNIDCVLEREELTVEVARELHLLEPFGCGNPTPLFALMGAEISEVTPIGQNRHTRILLTYGGFRYTAVYFGHTADDCGCTKGERVNLAFNLDVNEYRGVENLQLIVRDIGKRDVCRRDTEEAELLYEEIKSGKRRITEQDGILPERADFAAVFLYIKAGAGENGTRMSISKISESLKNGGKNAYVKTKFILAVFNEMDLIYMEETGAGGTYLLRVKQRRGKTDLTKSTIYKRLKSRFEWGGNQ